MDGKIPAYQTMMPDVVEALQFYKGEAKNPKIDEFVFKKLGVSSDQIKKFKAQIKWSRTYLKKYGIITNPKHAFWKLNGKYRNCDEEAIKQIIKEESQKYYAKDFHDRNKN